ncbi:MAG TPA: glutathione S-transferase family protein [Steroidobacteraceae bacterium]|nr:glutathione S-transferase family protein [Steroidobacteraceae bacterium]
MYTLITMPWVPPTFQGQVRDLPVRWALEEIGATYEVRLVDDAHRESEAYRAKQPFGKVPVLEIDGLTLFESAAIVQHLGETSWLLPADPSLRAQARAWMFAAMNSIDPDVIALGDIDHFAADTAWGRERRPELEKSLRNRLDDLAQALGAREYLVGPFSAADIVMITVFRALRHTALISQNPALRAYRDRCETRAAFRRALDAQLQTFQLHEPSAA